MALEQKLSVKMSQRLVMTPSLQQAIKLLQMSKLELVEEVQQELLENPVLEEGQVDTSPAERSEAESASGDAASDGGAETATDSAGEVIQELRRIYNRARQETITTELLDIVGGAEALA